MIYVDSVWFGFVQVDSGWSGWFGLMWDDKGWYRLIWVDTGWYGLIWVHTGWYGLIRVRKAKGPSVSVSVSQSEYGLQKLLLRSLKIFDSHWNWYIHCIYFSLNTQRQQGAGLKYYWIRNNNFNFSLSLWNIL